MAKILTNIRVGDQVAFNKELDAVWYDVLHIDRFNLTIRESGTNYATQVMDSCFVKQLRINGIVL